MAHERPTFGSDFRRFFGRGLTVLLPSILTLWLLWYAIVFVFNNVAVPINAGIRWAVVAAAPTVLASRPGAHPGWYEVSDEERADFLRGAEGPAFRGRPPE